MREVTEIELAAALSLKRRAFLGFELGLVINNSYLDSKLGVSCKTLFVARHEQAGPRVQNLLEYQQYQNPPRGSPPGRVAAAS